MGVACRCVVKLPCVGGAAYCASAAEALAATEPLASMGSFSDVVRELLARGVAHV